MLFAHIIIITCEGKTAKHALLNCTDVSIIPAGMNNSLYQKNSKTCPTKLY